MAAKEFSGGARAIDYEAADADVNDPYAAIDAADLSPGAIRILVADRCRPHASNPPWLDHSVWDARRPDPSLHAQPAMNGLADVYVENAGLLFLVAFAAASVALLRWRRHLSAWWWAGSMAGGAVMIVLTTMLAVMLRAALDPAGGGVSVGSVLAIGFAGLLGFIAATDVQLVWALVRGPRTGVGSVVAGALIGPMIIVGGYLLLTRSMAWVRLA